MPSSKETSTSKRRRPSEKTGRRFSVKEANKHELLPTTHPLSRKRYHSIKIARFVSFVAVVFLSVWFLIIFRRGSHRSLSRKGLKNSISNARSVQRRSFWKRREFAPQLSTKTFSYHHTNTDEVSKGDLKVSDADENGEANHSEQAQRSEAIDRTGKNDPSKDPVESIEWYSRDDYMKGTRPLCRISKPFVLNNGTILVPNWMSNYSKLLRRCGLGTFDFYPSSGPQGLEYSNRIDADFSLTIHLERLQEPTHVPSVYLTEHLLKSSFLFDVFMGKAHPPAGINEHYCYTTAADSKCEQKRPSEGIMKPAVFVPSQIESSPKGSWAQRLIDMFGVAYGHNNEVVHLNTSSILLKREALISSDLGGTFFRSVLSTPGMFRNLPKNGLQQSSLFSGKNSIIKTPKPKTPGKSCSLTIGIGGSSEDTSNTFIGALELKEKIDLLTKFALPQASIALKTIEIGSEMDFDAHIKEMQTLDMYIAGSGSGMDSIGFLRWKTSVFELMPFALKPAVHQNLAAALGIRYQRFRSKPRSDEFKKCIESEILHLRRRGRISLHQNPEWQKPLLEAWDKSIREYALFGRTEFDILNMRNKVNNYYSRLCAMKQNIDIEVDDIARKIVHEVKKGCAQQTQSERKNASL